MTFFLLFTTIALSDYQKNILPCLGPAEMSYYNSVINQSSPKSLHASFKIQSIGAGPLGSWHKRWKVLVVLPMPCFTNNLLPSHSWIQLPSQGWCHSRIAGSERSAREIQYIHGCAIQVASSTICPVKTFSRHCVVKVEKEMFVAGREMGGGGDCPSTY